ncbi:hypothetical protein M5K25_016506 [Dendrobium thyrsiflorum]|uniref:Uncharacterized protein n=1 Tax=Dendrobium thyrsiflorum TaxID=117978 RepID=A0ABD0UKA1_DENTH
MELQQLGRKKAYMVGLRPFFLALMLLLAANGKLCFSARDLHSSFPEEDLFGVKRPCSSIAPGKVKVIQGALPSRRVKRIVGPLPHQEAEKDFRLRVSSGSEDLRQSGIRAQCLEQWHSVENNPSLEKYRAWKYFGQTRIISCGSWKHFQPRCSDCLCKGGVAGQLRLRGSTSEFNIGMPLLSRSEFHIFVYIL